MDSPIAAKRLIGLTLADDWVVAEEIQREESATGGTFSVPYIVESPGGRRAFLKALDFSSALEAEDPAEEMNRLTAAYEHERAVLQICRDRKMKHVAMPIAEGVAVVPGFERGGRVNYLIFALAEGDARAHLTKSEPTDIAWRLRSLHHVAAGLYQLHINKAAHQDVKPSNVLTFQGEGWKLGDLGSASLHGTQSPRDEYDFAGDGKYAPPELLYQQVDTDWVRRRCGCDAYLLGNLAAVFFGGVSLSVLMYRRLDESLRFTEWRGSYAEVLPYVRSAFDECVEELDDHVRSISSELAIRLMPAIRQLCDPDPYLRGDPKGRRSVASQYSLVRYVSLFNELAQRAEYGQL